MTIFEMYKAGKFDDAIKKKALKPTIVPACNAYSLFLSFRNDGLKYDESVEKTADLCSISVSSIRRAISLVSK